MAEPEAVSEAANPLLSALPPATDYMTYLTILEYNLTPEDLPLLHDLLQDATLTVNIGWDLVMLLLPLLPASLSCLQTIARLGNAREVILKVTEALRFLELEGAQEETDSVTSEEYHERDASAATTQPEHLTAALHEDRANIKASEPQSPQSVDDLLLPIVQFDVLVTMLSTLHSRVKTKYPSRFLATTLQAVLAAFSRADLHIEHLTGSIMKFLKSVSSNKAPALPPRIPTSDDQFPGGNLNTPTPQDVTIQRRLLQAFVTHVVELYILALPALDDISGMAWSSILFECLELGRPVPGRVTTSFKLTKDRILRSRSSTMSQLLTLAQELRLDTEVLTRAALETSTSITHHSDEEEEPPSSSDEIPLSRTGSLFLLAATIAAQTLDETASPPEISLFPTIAHLLTVHLNLSGPGTDPEQTVDALVAVSLQAIANNQIGDPTNVDAEGTDANDDFTHFVQRMALLSATTSSSTLRYHAHFVTSSVLRTHPDPAARLSFILDTLKHCPYETLKASAVSWIKGETLEANPPLPSLSPQNTDADRDADISIFATPAALQTLSPHLFPDLRTHLTSTPPIFPSTQDNLLEAWQTFKANLPFHLAALNFLYLLLSAPHLYEPLDIAALFHGPEALFPRFLDPLRLHSEWFRGELQEGRRLAGEEGRDGVTVALGELSLLEDVLGRVAGAVAARGVM